MELTHSFTVPASSTTPGRCSWTSNGSAAASPARPSTRSTDDGFAGTVKVKLGPIALQYAGTGPFVERDDGAHRAVIEAKGKDKRGNGTAGATVTSS